MEPKFNIDRPKVSDEEINKNKDFDKLLKQFKAQSIQKAKLDKSWWKSKKVRYSAIIAGVTVVCTVTYLSIVNKQTSNKTSNETLITQSTTPEVKKQETTRTAFVSAPSSKLAIPYSAYKVNNSQGAEIKHPSKTKIKIPKNSFVDKNGKDIIGDVTIEYREFHDKGDIIAAGIPMGYDSAGHHYNLESAGMFDIIGTQNGEPVFIKPDKNLDVEFASINGEDRFNQYYLDTVERNWKYIRRDNISNRPEHNRGASPANNKKIESLRKEIEIIIPKKIDSVKVVYTKKTEALPKPKEPNKPAKPSGKQTFNIDASPNDFPELASFNNLLFEIGDENKNYTKEMNEITWNDLKISQGPQKGKNYLLTLTYRQRVEKLIVYPVLIGKDFEKAQNMFEQKLSVYEGLLEKRQKEEQRLLAEMQAKQKAYMEEQARKKSEYDKELAMRRNDPSSNEANELANAFDKMGNQARATRIFQVSSFGIHNSDCPRPMPESESVSPIFISSAKEKPISPDHIYLIDHSKNMVCNYERKDFSNIKYDAKNTNSFVVFVRNRMFICKKSDFKDAAENSSNKFIVTQLPESSENLIDFKKALEI